MKLLFVCQYYYPERIGLTDICEELVKRHYNVTVLTGLPNYPEGKVLKSYKWGKKRKENINGVKVIRCFEIGRHKGKLMRFINYASFYFSSLLKVKKLDKNFDKVICYQHSPITMASAAFKYKRLNDIKLILYCFDLWPESLKIYNISEKNPIYKRIYKMSNKIYKNCDKILVSSKPFIKYFEDVHHISKNRLYYLPQHSFDYGKHLIKNVKKDGKKHFLFAGNIGKTQNIDVIIKAVDLIEDKSNMQVDIVGFGSDYDRLVKMTKDYNLEKTIIFHGNKNNEEMYYFYSIADALLITLKDDPIISKTLPLKMNSYLSVGKPILGCINGAAADMIKELKCGDCCEANNHIQFEKIIRNFKITKYRVTRSMDINKNISDFLKEI